MLQNILSTINDLTLVFVAISPTVFIFSVTLLGTAIEQSEQEERIAEENKKTNLQDNINELDEAISKAKKDGDIDSITSQIESLKIQQNQADDKIKQIKSKYTAINLKNTVIYPCISFLIAILLVPIATYLKDLTVYLYIIISLQIVFISFGIYKIYLSLKLVQEISKNKKESEQFSRLKETIKQAIEEQQIKNKEELALQFKDVTFPLNANTDTEIVLNFRIKLTKGSVLNNVCVWFFAADEINFIKPPESEIWRQGTDYNPPNMKTVKVEVGTVSIGPYTPRSIKIKTPTIPGKYMMRYKLYADGYQGDEKNLVLIVG